MTAATIKPATRITPAVSVTDEHAAHWIARVIVALRREVCWCWRLRDSGNDRTGTVPPIADAAAENLDLIRYESDKTRFFETDPAARYLTKQMEGLPAPQRGEAVRGGWEWAAETLTLDDAAQFVLGLAMAARVDAAIGPVLAACMNDRSRPFPTLALAQRLWSSPLEITNCADAAHPLFRSGLLRSGDVNGEVNWLAPLEIHPAVALQLANPEGPLARGMKMLSAEARRALDESGAVLAERLRARTPRGQEIVLLIGPAGAAYEEWAGSLAALAGRQAAAVDASVASDASLLQGLAITAWLRNIDLVFPEGWSEKIHEKNWMRFFAPVESVATRWYIPVRSREAVAFVPNASHAPALSIPPLTFEQRVARYRAELGDLSATLNDAIEECSRRFRFQEAAIDRVAQTFRHTDHQPDLHAFILACRNEAAITMGGLAQMVVPRFSPDELVLPPRQKQQFREILTAMASLTEVHYRWGTARAWNESGLAVLFSGPPGTGKTMGAEAISTALELPMYRIDLSQVVNKYIGETEKNLRRIFDAAEVSDCILFFDEADALFGKRTEVKDAHDRFANIEISYLLERMERFKGLAILATNRRKDIDEAFVRRLRYLVEFPVPGVPEREQIWRQVFPGEVDVSALDFPYLARQFSLTGGHIRSVAFAACLQMAGSTRTRAERRVDMESVLVAVKRELEKMNRAAGDEVFGQHSDMLRERT